MDAHDCSAEALYTAFKDCLNKYEIPITNVIGLATDNAAVMTGSLNSFWTRLKADCPWAILIQLYMPFGSSAALISKAACSMLPSFVMKHVGKVSTYMNDSPKRCAELKDFQVIRRGSESRITRTAKPCRLQSFLFFQELYEVELLKTLKFSTTRWLVAQPCIERYKKKTERLFWDSFV